MDTSKAGEYDTIDPNSLNFVSPLPDYFHLKCPICLDLLLPEAPKLTPCCGSHFCERCIDRLYSRQSSTEDDEDEDDELDDPACPFCKEEYLETVTDKNHHRALKSLKVFCTKKSSGCVWQGELGELVKHLSSDSCTQHKECGDAIGTGQAIMSQSPHMLWTGVLLVSADVNGGCEQTRPVQTSIYVGSPDVSCQLKPELWPQKLSMTIYSKRNLTNAIYSIADSTATKKLKKLKIQFTENPKNIINLRLMMTSDFRNRKVGLVQFGGTIPSCPVKAFLIVWAKQFTGLMPLDQDNLSTALDQDIEVPVIVKQKPQGIAKDDWDEPCEWDCVVIPPCAISIKVWTGAMETFEAEGSLQRQQIHCSMFIHEPECSWFDDTVETPLTSYFVYTEMWPQAPLLSMALYPKDVFKGGVDRNIILNLSKEHVVFRFSKNPYIVPALRELMTSDQKLGIVKLVGATTDIPIRVWIVIWSKRYNEFIGTTSLAHQGKLCFIIKDSISKYLEQQSSSREQQLQQQLSPWQPLPRERSPQHQILQNGFHHHSNALQGTSQQLSVSPSLPLSLPSSMVTSPCGVGNPLRATPFNNSQIVWTGFIETYEMNGTVKQLRQAQCNMYVSKPETAQDIKPELWPTELTMSVHSKQIFNAIISIIKSNNLSCIALRNVHFQFMENPRNIVMLREMMTNDIPNKKIAIVYLKGASPNCPVKAFIMVCAEKNKLFTGLIPIDQDRFMFAMKHVFSPHKNTCTSWTAGVGFNHSNSPWQPRYHPGPSYVYNPFNQQNITPVILPPPSVPFSLPPPLLTLRQGVGMETMPPRGQTLSLQH